MKRTTYITFGLMGFGLVAITLVLLLLRVLMLTDEERNFHFSSPTASLELGKGSLINLSAVYPDTLVVRPTTGVTRLLVPKEIMPYIGKKAVIDSVAVTFEEAAMRKELPLTRLASNRNMVLEMGPNVNRLQLEGDVYLVMDGIDRERFSIESGWNCQLIRCRFGQLRLVEGASLKLTQSKVSAFDMNAWRGVVLVSTDDSRIDSVRITTGSTVNLEQLNYNDAWIVPTDSTVSIRRGKPLHLKNNIIQE